MKFQLRGEGPAVLLVHGIPTCGRLWDLVVEVLQHDFTCVIVDLPGMGGSAPFVEGSRDPSRYAKEIEMLRRELSIPAWHVVGHDAGSTIAVHYVAEFRNRVRKVILCSPPIFPELRPPWIFRLLRARFLGPILAPFMIPLIWRFGLSASVKRQDELTAEIINAFHRPFTGIAGAIRFVQVLRWGDPAQVLARTAALLPTITAPTLLLHGQFDETIPVSFATRGAALIPNASICILDSDHYLPLNCPNALCHHLVRFLKQG